MQQFLSYLQHRHLIASTRRQWSARWRRTRPAPVGTRETILDRPYLYLLRSKEGDDRA